MFPANFAREITRQLNAIRMPHRILINKSKSVRNPGPPLEMFDTAVTVYLHSDSIPKPLTRGNLGKSALHVGFKSNIDS